MIQSHSVTKFSQWYCKIMLELYYEHDAHITFLQKWEIWTIAVSVIIVKRTFELILNLFRFIEFQGVDQPICCSFWNGRTRSNKAKEGFILLSSLLTRNYLFLSSIETYNSFPVTIKSNKNYDSSCDQSINQSMPSQFKIKKYNFMKCKNHKMTIAISMEFKSKRCDRSGWL